MHPNSLGEGPIVPKEKHCEVCTLCIKSCKQYIWSEIVTCPMYEDKTGAKGYPFKKKKVKKEEGA